MDLTRLLDDPRPFALLRRRTPGHDEQTVELLLGPVTEYERLADIPDEGLALVPFRQIRERGFDVRDDGTPLSVLVPEEAYELSLAEALAQLPAHDVRVEDGGFDVPDEEYAEIIGRVLREEIGRGEGANFVIRRTYEGAIPGFGRADALALFRRLLEGERGAELAEHGIEVSQAGNGEVHAVRGPGFAGVQFHPESILTLGGVRVVRELVEGVRALRTP